MTPNPLRVALAFAALTTAQINTASPYRKTEFVHVPILIGVDLKLPPNAFGSAIEGVAVNTKGDVFAADFRGRGQAASSAYAIFNQVEYGITKILDESVNPFFVAVQDDVANPPLLAGARFRREDELLLTGTELITVCARHKVATQSKEKMI